MTTAEFLSHLYRLDVKVWEENGELCCDVPKAVLTAALRDELAARKPEILAFLQDASVTRTQSTLGRVSRNGGIPLSFAQQRLWFLEQLEPGTSTYNIARAFRITGDLNVEILRAAFTDVVNRHESLRTVFPDVRGDPVQKIADRGEPAITTMDLRQTQPPVQRESDIQSIIAKETRRPFDLAKGPLLRVVLLRLTEQEHVLILTMHHIVSDGWSMSILYRELAVLYQAFLQRQPSPLPELPIQYADYAVWQREWLRGQVLEQHLVFWRQQVAGAPAVFELPTDRPRPGVQTFRGSRQYVMLPKTLSEALKTLGRRESVTLYMTLLGAFNVLLHRYTGQSDIVVGSPIAGRTQSETEELIGYFANTLVVRTDLSGDPSFRSLLKRVRDVALGVYTHQDLPFEKLVEELQPQRDLSYNPLFQVLFALHNIPSPLLELPGLTVAHLGVDNGISRFDLALDLREQPEGLAGWLEYNKDLFEAETISRMIGHFQTLLGSIVVDPDQRLSTLALLTEAERRQLLVDWNGTSTDDAHDQCLAELFEAQVSRTPEAVAVVFEGAKLTYRELNQRANRLAHYLKKLGVKAEVPVAICVERSLDMLVGLVAILKAGGAYVPLDPDYPTERLAYMLEDIQAPVLVSQQELVDKLPPQSVRLVCLDVDEGIIAEESEENLPTATTPENLAYVIYTSGSTGRPKGVQICHRSVCRLIKTTRPVFGFGEDDVWTFFHSYSFDFSVWEIWGALLQGGRLVVVPRDTAQSSDAFNELLRREQVTVLNQTPSAIRQLIEVGRQTMAKEQHADSSCAPRLLPDASHDLSLRLIICGGEAFPAELASSLLEWNVPAWNFYGPTEGTVWATISPIAPIRSERDSIPIGRPIGNRQIYLLDQNLQAVPIGIPGELHIGGVGLARGYWNCPDLTAEKFIPNPFSSEPGARLYRTGDLARYLPDGNIEFLGRIDNQVKIRGFRIELGEIEGALHQHPAVREAVVLAREDVPSQRRLVAYVVPSQIPSIAASALRSFLKAKLPDYMIPSSFMFLDGLPLTPNGKVDRRAVPVPGHGRPELDQTLVAPRTPTEDIIAEIWTAILKLDKVGIHDNFFELGGHSLLATQLVSRLRDTFRVELSLRAFFEGPTVAELAVQIVQLQTESDRAGDTAEMLADVESLSDEEAARLLDQESASRT